MSSHWNVPPPTYDAPSTRTTTLTPYLQLNHLLSLTWLAYPILSLVFVAFRLQLSLDDAQSAAASAKDDLLASCQAAEQAATSAASLPRFMALATNRQYAEAVNGAMDAARAALVLSLTVMEAIINFIVDIYRSTFLCFLELVVQGGLAVLIGAVQEINNVLQSVTSALRAGIQNDIASANTVITNAINAINKVNPFGNITPPQITIPSLDSLQNVSLPQSFTDALTSLNASIPTVSDLKDKVNAIIDTPFELLKQDINATFANLTFDPEGLPVPDLQQLTFCSDLDTSVIDDVSHDFVKIAKIGVIILILLALLLTGLNCLLTWYKWRCMKNHLQYTRDAWMTDPTMVHIKSSVSAPQITMSDHNLLMLRADSEHPLTTRIMNQLSARFSLSPVQHTHIQWFLHYIFHPPALACFLIGFFGLLSVQIQLFAIGPLEAKYQVRAASTVADFSTTIATTINNSMYNQSSLYANVINGRVDTVQSTINDGVFGWVNGTTTTLNDTINAFYDDIQNAVNTVFNGSIFENPVNDFIKCFIGSKVDAIEEALTFLHDNLHVVIPRVNETVLILSPDSVNEVSQPIAAAAVGGGSGDNDGLIGRLVNSYVASLKKERIMFAVFMALWGVVVLMGFSVIFWHSVIRPYLDKRGRKRWETEQRVGIQDIGPFLAGNVDVGCQGSEKKAFTSFSPLPSPRGSVFKPFWSSRSNSPTGREASPISSQESVRELSQNEISHEDALVQKPTTPALVKKKSAKLLALGRKAMRGGRLKKDGTEDEIDLPLSPSPVAFTREPIGPRNKAMAVYGKLTGLFSKKKDDAEQPRDCFGSFEEEELEESRPKLQIYTQRGLDKYGHPRSLTDSTTLPRHREHGLRSHWSTSPGATQTSWIKVMSPTKKAVYANPAPTMTAQTPIVIVSQEPDTPSYPASHPPIRIPIRDRRPSVPLDVGSEYEDSTRPTTMAPAPAVLPVPLYSGPGVAPQAYQFPQPPRHPHLQNAFSNVRHQPGDGHSSPPPPSESPRMYQPQLALAPPPASPYPNRHKRAFSLATTATSQWRVTNAAPGDYSSSAASLASRESNNHDQAQVAQEQTSLTPVTRLLTTIHVQHSSTVVNPFITPFDDEHRVRISHQTGAGARKSIPTNPFVHAI